MLILLSIPLLLSTANYLYAVKLKSKTHPAPGGGNLAIMQVIAVVKVKHISGIRDYLVSKNTILPLEGKII